MRWLVSVGVLGAGLAAPRVAEACSPWDPVVYRTIPDGGDTHPANAPVLLAGQVLDPLAVEATVGGVSVEVVLDPRSHALSYFLWESAYRTLVLQLVPAPLPGQTVLMFGNPCLHDDEYGCRDWQLQFTAGEPDPDGPVGEVDLWYDVYANGEVGEASSSCGTTSAEFEIDVRTELDPPGLETPLYYALYRRPREMPGAWTLVADDWRTEDDDRDPSFRFLSLWDEVQAWLPLGDAFCFELRTFDLAGNSGPVVETCPPCHDQLGTDGGFIAWPDGEPNYTDDSIVRDGYCALEVGEGTSGEPDPDGGSDDGWTDGSSDEGASSGAAASAGSPGPEPPDTQTGGGQDPGAGDDDVGSLDRGCGCRSDPRRGGSDWQWLLVGLGLIARSRHAR